MSKKQKQLTINSDTATTSPRCPQCKAPIGVQATVAKFGEPQAWDFWGTPGERWKLCEGAMGAYRFIHFKATVNGRFSHRLAWIQATAEPAAVQGELI